MSYTQQNGDNTFDDRTPKQVASRINQLMGDGLGTDLWIDLDPQARVDDSFVIRGGIWHRKDAFAMGSKRVKAPAGHGVIGFRWEDGAFLAHNFGVGTWENGIFVGAAFEAGATWNRGLWCGTQMLGQWKGGTMVPVEGKEFSCQPQWVMGHRTLYIGRIRDDQRRNIAQGADRGLLVWVLPNDGRTSIRIIHGISKNDMVDYSEAGRPGQHHRECDNLWLNLQEQVKKPYTKRFTYLQAVEDRWPLAMKEASDIIGVDMSKGGVDDPYYRFMQLFHK